MPPPISLYLRARARLQSPFRSPHCQLRSHQPLTLVCSVSRFIAWPRVPMAMMEPYRVRRQTLDPADALYDR